MDIDAIRKSYRRYARSYDFYFGAVFQPGRRAVIEKLNCQSGDRILEVGVGTGLSLPLYPGDVYVTGIDLSSHMLERARARKDRDGLDNVDLYEMDAEDMRFEDDSFDKVVAMYVASVVPHPERLVAEMHRVCKPGGELFIVNHFHSTYPLVAAFEKLLSPLSKLMGFRPDLRLDAFVRDTGLDLVDVQPVNLLGYWTLLRARNNKPTCREEALPLVDVPAAVSR
ncbi:MAG TPA: methyltransferase domain-containing protein [Candidatus Competibacteraceae bacterium]|nr:methyltransferase domain-containing protein [Candidatus Competibacteraceae bacterium]